MCSEIWHSFVRRDSPEKPCRTYGQVLRIEDRTTTCSSMVEQKIEKESTVQPYGSVIALLISHATPAAC